MTARAQLPGGAPPLPFFCSSNSLVFYLDESTTFSQNLTLYNPYDFPVRYKVLCTSPRTYVVAEPQGEIRPQHSVDTTIRLLNTSTSSDQHVVHRIRIQYFDRRKPQELIGKRDVTCTVLAYKPVEERFEEENKSSASRVQTTIVGSQGNPLVLAVLSVIGVICAIVLTLPDLENNSKTRLPTYLHITTHSKVIASYILGLLTVVFIRR